ncbi:YncE family protein, partial [Bacillus thuringiensis]|nr:YncE family protein [Bacillus thuringiensis]
PTGATGMPGSPRIYVQNRNSNNVSVIDGESNIVIKTITVGTQPFGGSIDASKHRLYVANSGSGNVSVIDTIKNAVIATITVGSQPRGVIVNQVTNKIYVVNNNGNVSVIDGSSNEVITTITLGISGLSLEPNVDVLLNKIYVPHYGSNSVSVIDGSNDGVITIITGLHQPFSIGINSASQRAYISNSSSTSGSISRINTTTDAIIDTISISNPAGVAVNTLTNKIYVASTDGDISVIDGSRNTVIETIPLGVNSRELAVNPFPTFFLSNFAATLLYTTLGNLTGNRVAVIDQVTNTIIATVTVGDAPVWIGIDPFV